MAFRLTIGGSGETAQIPIESVRTEEIATAGGMVATASFDVTDPTAAETFSAKQAVVIDDDGGSITYFKGEIAGVPEKWEIAPGKVVWHIECQDYNQLLVETVVTSYSAAAGTLTDAAIIDAMVSAARGESDIDSTSHVTQLVAAANMEDFAVRGVSLAEAMTKLCEQTGGRFYVDFNKNLHYYATSPTTEADGLSDNPDGVNTFRHWGLRRLGDAGIINAVYVVGKEVADWVTDAGSVGTYGSREVAVVDQGVNSAAKITDVANPILAANKDGAVTYECYTERGGLDAGNLVELTDSAFGLAAEALLLLKKETTFVTGTKPIYKLTLGDDLFNAPSSVALPIDRVKKTEERIWELDVLAAHGWTHDIVFSATDNDTVEWAAGNIYLAGGVDTFAIDAGNTGNMAATTYIYFDTDASTSALQVDTDASNCVGANKIWIGVAKNVAAGKNATFFSANGPSNMGLIVAGEITAGTIVADLLAANCVTAAKLEATLTLSTVIQAGGGTINIDSNGIFITSKNATTPDTHNAIVFQVSSTEYASLSNFWYSPGGAANDYHVTMLLADDIAGYDTTLRFQADKAAGQVASIEWTAPQDTLRLVDDSTDNYLQLVGTAPRFFIDQEATWDDNTNMTIGITINQAGNDDQILAFKSSDIAHGITDVIETDTYADFRKTAAATGGLLIRGFTEDDIGVEIQGWATNDDTNKNATADAYVAVNCYKKSGTGHADPGADANLFAVQKRGASVFIVDEDGDLIFDGGTLAFHEHDDIALVRELSDYRTNRVQSLGIDAGTIQPSRVRQLGIVSETINGIQLVSSQKRQALMEGALLQLDERIRKLEAKG